MIKNEKIRAAEVELTGLNGEQLGIVPTSEALAMAKRLKVDLVCLSLMSSPPPCKLIERERPSRRRSRPARRSGSRR